MSRNLVKQVFAVEAEEKRVIDTNELVRQRMETSAARTVRTDRGGPVSGSGSSAEAETPEDGEEDRSSALTAKEDAAALLEQARADAQAVIGDAEAQAEHILSEARAQAESDKVSIMELARQQGYEEGQRNAMAQVESARLEFQEKARQMEEEYQRQIDELEPKFIDTITAVYEHIFRVDLSASRDILTYLINNTMHRVEGGHTYLIHVSREDYDYVETQKQQLLNGVVSDSDTVDVLEDIALGKNDCLIETENGIFDCGLGTQLAELKKKLMLLAWSGEE